MLRRVVTDAATGAVAEDTDFGYDGPGDSPAYNRPHNGGSVTTYLGDVIYTGTTGVWQVANLHGDVVGTTDAAGAFSAHPQADEFGVGPAPADRLGWLGGKDRFYVGGRLGLIRMGVRLYDTTTGRFTSVDPVEGGSANNYDYVSGDPVNKFDLDGMCEVKKTKGVSWRRIRNASCRAKSKVTARGVARVAGRVATWTGRGALVLGGGAVIVGTGGVAGGVLLGGSVALGVTSTGASAVQWGAGVRARDRCAIRNGAMGTAVGVITFGTWGAVGGAGANFYAGLSRQGVSEAVGYSC